MSLAAPVPLTILTGFLGAGKTTLLNRVLGAQHHHRIGLIVNELGRIDVDGKLLKGRAGDVVELAGGCVCHEARTQEELWGAIEEILARSRVDRIILETTGIAEPDAVKEALAELPAERRRVTIDHVVTIVDAESALLQIDRHAEARAQIQAADAIVLSKLDVAPARIVPHLHEALAGLNPAAERVAFPLTDEGTAALAAFLLHPVPGPRGSRTPGHAEHQHGSTHQLAAIAVSETAPLLAEPLLQMCREMGDALVRAKGFVHLVSEERRGYLDRAGTRLELRLLDPWPPGERRSELVFIGIDLDADRIQRQVWAARARA